MVNGMLVKYTESTGERDRRGGRSSMHVHFRSGADRVGLRGHRETLVRPSNRRATFAPRTWIIPSIPATTEGGFITKNLSATGAVPFSGLKSLLSSVWYTK